MSNFIKSAIKKPGALTASAKKAGQSPMSFAQAHQHDSGKTGQRARFALLMQKLRNRKGK